MNKIFKLTKLKIVIAFVILLSSAGFGYWQFVRNKNQAPQYQTATVERGNIVSSVSASGQVLTTNVTKVTTKASGIVEKVYVEDDQAVEKGQTIMTIALDQTGQVNQSQAWSTYLTAQATLETAKQNKLVALKKIESAKSSLITAQFNAEGTDDWDPTDKNKQKIDADRRAAEITLQEAQEEYDSHDLTIQKAEAGVKNVWLSYQQTLPTIIAPISGKIAKLTSLEGMSVESESTGTQTIALIKTQALPMASFNLSEIDVSQVKAGQKATIILDSLPEQTFTGKVISVDRVGAVTSGVTTYPVVIRFDTDSEQILPNMTATSNIIIDKKDNVLLVPSSAIQTQDNQSFVRVLKNNQSQLVPVETGLVSDTQTEIISGVAEGDLVIISSITNSQNRDSSPFGGAGMGGMMRIAR